MYATIAVLSKRGIKVATTTKHLLRPGLVNLRKYNFSTSCVRNGRLYSDKHEWAEVNGKIATIGISHYAQDALGDIVYVQLPQVGSEFNKMDEVGTIESVKASSELYCPLTGKVTEKNEKLDETPDIINKSCYGNGWLFKLQFTKDEELEELMNEEQYQKFLNDQQS